MYDYPESFTNCTRHYTARGQSRVKRSQCSSFTTTALYDLWQHHNCHVTQQFVNWHSCHHNQNNVNIALNTNIISYLTCATVGCPASLKSSNFSIHSSSTPTHARVIAFWPSIFNCEKSKQKIDLRLSMIECIVK